MEEINSNLLLTPAPKKVCRFPKEYPFPIIRNDTDSEEDWKCVIGHLQEDCVLVDDEEDMKLLYTKGFFGKGTLSKNAPQICFKQKERAPSKRERSGLVRAPEFAVVGEVLEIITDDEEIEVVDKTPKANEKPKKEEIEVVLSDSNATSDEERDYSEKASGSASSDVKECLQLSFEEAYFLSYALGCLVVKDKDQPLDLTRLWNKFCELSTPGNFPVIYTAYHHFRSKGWIVKSGVSYGVDFVLYKDGPPFYHATYSVIVKPVKEQNLRDATGGIKPLFTWGSLAAMSRLNASAGKGLLLLYVIKPNGISENKISTPFCISQFKLEEVMFNRWVPSENREEET